jgi:branched-chain amino acid transport system substrate-binding protein
VSGRTAAGAAVAAGLVGLALTGAAAGDALEPGAHRVLGAQRLEYTGPGRDDPAPTDLEAIGIGWFAPDDPEDPDHGGMWLAARMAVADANAAGGYGGVPFRLVPAWSDNPWGTGVARLARAAYNDGVWAVVGSVDGTATHLAEQVVAKALLTLVDPASTDATVNLANVPWMFSCLPTDERLADAVGRALARAGRTSGVVLVSGTDHDSRRTGAELARALAGAGIAIRYRFDLDSSVGGVAEAVAATGVADVVVAAGPADSARLVVELRARASGLRIVGGPGMALSRFVELAGDAADGVLFPSPCDPALLSGGVAERFAARSGRRPDCRMAQTYDAVRLVIEAVRAAGPNRARIRDAVATMGRWRGAAGTVEWDAVGRNRRKARLATVVGARCPADGECGTAIADPVRRPQPQGACTPAGSTQEIAQLA